MKRRRRPQRRWRGAARDEQPAAGSTGGPAGLLFWAELIVAVAGVLAIAYAVVTFAAGSVDEMLGDAEGAGRIEVRQVVVGNGPAEYRSTDSGYGQTRATTPQVDVTVRNTGSEPVLLTEALITIEDSTLLPGCIYGGGGDVPVSKAYAIELPVWPTGAERVLRHDLHEEVPPGEVDRPLLLFEVPPSPDNHLYALRIQLRTDGGETIDIGRFVLAAPGPVPRGGHILPEDNDTLGYNVAQYRLLSTWCFRHNLAAVKRFVAHDGKRSPETAALADVRVTDRWQHYADRRSAREAIDPLLRSDMDGPWLAAFAAERTGDEQLAAATRRRGAEVLLRRAEQALDDDWPGGAIEDLRIALWLAPSSDTRRLLQRAEAAQQERDAQTEE